MIVAGILAALAAAVANTFAVVYQAAEDRRSPPAQAGRFALLGSLVHRPRWVAGTGLMVLAWPLQILALGFAPITVVQPTLSATQLVLLAVARVKLGERVGLVESLGAVAIVTGVSAVIVAGPRHSVPNPPAERVAVALAVVGAAALSAYVTGRLKPRRALALVSAPGSPMPGSISSTSCWPTTSPPAGGGWPSCGWPRPSPSAPWPCSRRTPPCSAGRRSRPARRSSDARRRWRVSAATPAADSFEIRRRRRIGWSAAPGGGASAAAPYAPIRRRALCARAVPRAIWTPNRAIAAGMRSAFATTSASASAK